MAGWRLCCSRGPRLLFLAAVGILLRSRGAEGLSIHRKEQPLEASKPGTSLPTLLQNLHRLGKPEGLGVPGPEYGFVPAFIAPLLPKTGQASWASNCFKEATASVRPADTAGHWSIHLQFSGKKEVLCDEAYLFASPYRYAIEEELLPGSKSMSWTTTSPEEAADLEKHGVQLFQFRAGLKDAVADIYTTAKMFVGALTGGPGVPKSVAEQNLDFLKLYANIDMPPRSSSAFEIDPAWIQSGDFFGIVRLDGLDPLIMWGTGSHVGHTTMALRDGNTLYVVESQEKSAYWPQDRVQKTEFSVWLEWAKKADYSVVWMPLREEMRAKWDNAAAWAAFENYEGMLYGFPNMLWGWIDTPHQNMPSPLSPEIMKVAFAIADPIYRHSTHWPSLWNGAWAKRLGLPLNLTTAEILAAADAKGVSFPELISMPEDDSWIYPGVKNDDGTWLYKPGPAMVCNVFVCRMWRAGGIVGNDFNCGEFTPFDDYELSLFNSNSSALPAECQKEADGQGYVQILGDYKISLPHANTVVPFKNMRNKCPATAPDYADRLAAASYC